MTLEPDRDQIEIFVEAIFRHADQGYVAVRSFYEDAARPFRLISVPLWGKSSDLRFLIEVAEDEARRAAQDPKRVVFCPPLATFFDKKRAREEDIADGLALSVDAMSLLRPHATS